MTKDIKPLNVFISYTHKDCSFKNALITHLNSLIRQKYIRIWFDNMILPGENIDEKVKVAMSESQIFLLLISSDYLSSYYCYEIELKEAMERREKGKVEVIPIIVRSVDLTGTPFDKLKSLPADRKPISSYSDKDKAYTEIVKGLRSVIEPMYERILFSDIEKASDRISVDERMAIRGSGCGDNFGFQFNGPVTINNSTFKTNKS